MGSIVKFRGFLVYIEADQGKLDKIRDFPEPRCKDNVASFIGLVKTLNIWSGALRLKMENSTKSKNT